MYKASTVTIEQSILLKMAALGNGNVVAQMHTLPSISDPAGTVDDLRLYCEYCGQSRVMSLSVLTSENLLLKELEWCKAHRHEQVPTPVARPSSKVTLQNERKLKDVL